MRFFYASAIFCCVVLSQHPLTADEAGSTAAKDQAVWLDELPHKVFSEGINTYGEGTLIGEAAKRIRFRGKEHPHSIGMRVDGVIDFDLDGQYKTFETTVAIEDAGPAPLTDVYFQVECDERCVLWTSQGHRRIGDRQSIVLDVSGVRKLTLRVGYGRDRRNASGPAIAAWLSPSLKKSEPEPQGSLPPLAARDSKAVMAWREHLQLIQKLVREENFAELEKIAAAARKDSTMTDEKSQLTIFYEQVAMAAGADEAAVKKLERWRKAFPDQPTASIALGQMFVIYAWNARGRGPGSTVTEERAELFQNRLAFARETLEATLDNKAGDPHAYNVLVNVALGQGWSKQEMFELVRKRMARQPTCNHIFHTAALFLEPRWYGEPGDIEKFARQAREKLGGERGDRVYAYLALTRWKLLTPRCLEGFPFEYQLIKPGLLAMVRDNPFNSHYAESLALLACQSGDWDTAFAMFQRHGHEQSQFIHWGHPDQKYFAFRRSDPDLKKDPSTDLDAWGRLIQDVAFGDDNQVVYGCSPNGLICRWAIAPTFAKPTGVLFHSPRDARFDSIGSQGPMLYVTGSIIDDGKIAVGDLDASNWRVPPTDLEKDYPAQSGAVSPDQKWLAVQANDQCELMHLEDENRKKLLQTGDFADVAFSADSARLITAGAHGKVLQWDVASGKETELFTQKHGVCRIALTPDDKHLWLASRVGPIRRYDFETQKSQVVLLKSPPWAIACSPKSPWVAVGREDGKISLLDPQTLKEVRLLHGHVAGVHRVKFSTDGRWLVSAAEDGVVKLWDTSLFKRDQAR